MNQVIIAPLARGLGRGSDKFDFINTGLEDENRIEKLRTFIFTRTMEIINFYNF